MVLNEDLLARLSARSLKPVPRYEMTPHRLGHGCQALLTVGEPLCQTLPQTIGRLKGSPMNGSKYQVALSFAGEQRDYVDEVARYLQNRSIALFYDGFERVRPLGPER